MRRNLTALGHARVYRHERTGELVVDTDTLRRGTFAGGAFGAEDDEDFEGDDDFDDLEGDDFGDDEDGDFEGDDDLDDIEGDDDLGDEIGRRRRRRRRSKRDRKRARAQRDARRAPVLGRVRTAPPPKKETWGMTAVGGTDQVSGNTGGRVSVKIRLQHDFRAQDITFTGSAADAVVTSIFFGDRVVWSNSDGIHVDVFAATGFLRGLLKGQSLKAGLDITVNGTLPRAGAFKVTLTGLKPVTTC